MKATTLILAFAVIAAVASAQNITGLNCTTNNAICSTTNSMFCCARLVRVVNASYTNTSQICVNQTVLNGTVPYVYSSFQGNATCIVAATATNNSFLVKLSVAVASLGFLSLFL
jgi:hypothetical protein